MKKVIIGLSVTYIVLLAIIVGLNIDSDKNNYYNYKKKSDKTVVAKPNFSKEKKQDKVVDNKKISEQKDNKKISEQKDNKRDIVEDKKEEPKKEVDKYANVQITRDLSIGTQGEDVKKLQSALLKKGYFKDNISGFFGNKTVEAIKKFQKQANIKPVDGICGKQTKVQLIK